MSNLNKIIKINSEVLLSPTHLFKTDNGFIEVQNLKKGNVIIGYKGISKITNLI